MSSVSKNESRLWFFTLIIILLIKGALSILLIHHAEIDLSPDESQYWTWSQTLSYGYYSKPPGIAWQIFLTTFLFGNTVFGIRIGAIFLNFCLALALYYTARSARFSKKSSFWGSIAFSFSPFGIFYSFPATTDLGMMLFFMLAIAECVKSDTPNYLKAGFLVFLSALFKWTAYIFWIFPFLLFLIYRDQKLNIKFVAGVLISLCALVPSVVWNLDHEGATFKHVLTTLMNPKKVHSLGSHGNFLDFLGSQIGLIFPIFFVLMALSVIWALRSKQKSSVFLSFAPLLTLVYFLASLYKKMQPNWALALYLPGFVLMGEWTLKKCRNGLAYLSGGVGFSILFAVAAIAIPYIQSHSLFPAIQIPYNANPFKQTLGWSNLEKAFEEINVEQNSFLFADKYQIASILSFYNPKKQRAYFFNLGKSRKNQFSYWPGMNPQEIGKNGYFVIAENTKDFEGVLPWYLSHYQGKLAPYFENVSVAKVVPLFHAYGKIVKFAVIFACENYNGQQPVTPDKW